MVTFHPDIQFPSRVEKIAQQVTRVIVVDNHSDSDSQGMLKLLADQDAQLSIIWNDKNLGVATALNQGIALAKQMGFQWVVTFDQDSEIEDNAISHLAAICEDVRALPGALIGSNHIDANSHRYYIDPARYKNRNWIYAKTVITSGTLLSMGVFDDIGPFREEFFIDGVDHEYCLRARSKRYKVILSLKPLLRHPMGNRKVNHLPFCPSISLPSTNYPPTRWYFMTRNRLTLIREYFVKDFSWAISRLIRLIGSAAIMLFLEQNRMTKLKYIRLGVYDWAKNDFSRSIDNLESC